MIFIQNSSSRFSVWSFCILYFKNIWHKKHFVFYSRCISVVHLVTPKQWLNIWVSIWLNIWVSIGFSWQCITSTCHNCSLSLCRVLLLACLQILFYIIISGPLDPACCPVQVALIFFSLSSCAFFSQTCVATVWVCCSQISCVCEVLGSTVLLIWIVNSNVNLNNWTHDFESYELNWMVFMFHLTYLYHAQN